MLIPKTNQWLWSYWPVGDIKRLVLLTSISVISTEGVFSHSRITRPDPLCTPLDCLAQTRLWRLLTTWLVFIYALDIHDHYVFSLSFIRQEMTADKMSPLFVHCHHRTHFKIALKPNYLVHLHLRVVAMFLIQQHWPAFNPLTAVGAVTCFRLSTVVSFTPPLSLKSSVFSSSFAVVCSRALVQPKVRLGV